jgi:hypothetical protein
MSGAVGGTKTQPQKLHGAAGAGCLGARKDSRRVRGTTRIGRFDGDEDCHHHDHNHAEGTGKTVRSIKAPCLAAKNDSSHFLTTALGGTKTSVSMKNVWRWRGVKLHVRNADVWEMGGTKNNPN